MRKFLGNCSHIRTAGALLLCTMVFPCISLAATVTPSANGSWDQNWNNAPDAGGISFCGKFHPRCGDANWLNSGQWDDNSSGSYQDSTGFPSSGNTIL